MSDRIRMDEPPSGVLPPGASPEPKPPVPTPEPEPVPEPQPEPEPEPAAASGEGEPKPAAPDADLAKGLRERVDQLTREKWDARRQADQLAAQLAELQKPAPQPGAAPDPVEVAKQQLRAEMQLAEFNAACNRTFAAGKAEFPDFEQAVQSLNAVGAGQRADFLQMVTALPDGHKVYRQLAGNLDEAARVLSLPQPMMALELAKLAQAASHPAVAAPASPAASQAPDPIRPIGGASRSVPSLENMSMAEFIKARDKQDASNSRIAR